MRLAELEDLFDKGRVRSLMLGDEAAGVVAALDMEGRLYSVLNGEIMNWVNPDAYLQPRPHGKYLVPGGDGLWAAPEGTRLGYHYSAGAWRVPPGIGRVRYDVIEKASKAAVIRAEIDLVNNSGVGVPVVFERRILVQGEPQAVTTSVEERITYLGPRTLTRRQCLLAPWSLAPVPHGPGCTVVFPGVDATAIWDLYDPSDAHRCRDGECWRTKTDGSVQYQIGLDATADWVEFVYPNRGIRVRRSASPIPAGQHYIDIADAPPNQEPGGKGARLSVYTDGTRGFTELEAAGGCPEQLEPSTVLTLDTKTRYAMG